MLPRGHSWGLPPANWNQIARFNRGASLGDIDLPNVTNRLNASLERILPEKRLFLRSDDNRFVRLR
ncbi:DUF5930 domain-containing protein, partial [Paracoccus sp. (in: a-proteobacteria)]|uniref:DUF5930 domain-containing protein n=1 Tax=Paracoccus sp. TaxID=267 RepID=UPI0035B4736F